MCVFIFCRTKYGTFSGYRQKQSLHRNRRCSLSKADGGPAEHAGHTFSGAGRSRTAVQTSNKSAFYTLILWLFFESATDKDTQDRPYSLKIHNAGGKNALLSHSREHLRVVNRWEWFPGDVLFRPLWAELS